MTLNASGSGGQVKESYTEKSETFRQSKIVTSIGTEELEKSIDLSFQ